MTRLQHFLTVTMPLLSDSTAITREILWNVPGWLTTVFYLLTFLACVWAGMQFVKRFRQHRRGQSLTGSVDISKNRSLIKRILSVVRYLTFHEQLRRDAFAGTAHLLMFYGFFILFIGTCLVFLEHDTPLHFFYGTFYLIASLVIDLGGVAFLVGLTMFLYRRRLGNSKRILDRFYVAALVWLLWAIGITGFLLEGARIAVDMPDFERWSVVGYAIASLLNSVHIAGDTAQVWHRWLWACHAMLCVAFFALLPWRFFSHTVYSPLSWAMKSPRKLSALRPVSLQFGQDAPMERSRVKRTAGLNLDWPVSEGTSPSSQSEEDPAQATPGATRWSQFHWLDLLQADACTTCGRCNEVCPANAAGKPLQPRDIVLGIREAMNRDGGSLTDQISDDAIWSCTTCGACNQACPVGIDVYDKIVDLRRGKVESQEIPLPAVERFQSLIEHSNPFNRTQESRLSWAAGLSPAIADQGESIPLLYWIGCAGSCDPDGQRVSRAMIKILNHLNIQYRILGKRERCSGDPARRMGEEGLFQELAMANIATFEAHGVQQVLTHCPHCFNIFKNEYPQLHSLHFSVEHHSQFLARMLDAGRLKLVADINAKITFHDPCYLGRGNGDTHSPRQILSQLPKTEMVEMPRHGNQSFCCGAGGGSLWMDVAGNQRIENLRSAEAAATGATIVVTCCPFCRTMLEAGRQTHHNESQLAETADLAELIVRAMGI